MVKLIGLCLLVTLGIPLSQSWRLIGKNFRFAPGNHIVRSLSSQAPPSTMKESAFRPLQSLLHFGLMNLFFFQSTKTVFAEGTVLEEVKSIQVSPEVQYIETESGLKYKDVKVGTGESPVPGDTVRVHYTGWLDNFDSEKKFDSSYDRRSPLVFKVGVKQVIAGWVHFIFLLFLLLYLG